MQKRNSEKWPLRGQNRKRSNRDRAAIPRVVAQWSKAAVKTVKNGVKSGVKSLQKRSKVIGRQPAYIAGRRTTVDLRF